MSGQTSGQRTASRYTQRGVNALLGGQADFLLNPSFLQGRQLALELANSPLSWNPQTIQAAENNVDTNAYGAFRGQMGQIREQASAAQGFRSGTTRMQERQAAQGLGDTIATGHRAIQTQAALQRPQDLIAAMQAQLPLLQMQYQWPRDIAATYSGAASNPIWSQPSPLAQAGQGAGSLAGALIGGGKL